MNLLIVPALKDAILCELAVKGSGHFREEPTEEAIQAVAQLVAAGLVRDEECENGCLRLVITRRGLEAFDK